jgi:glycosyltransferase involved in cell wall biosynthesis
MIILHVIIDLTAGGAEMMLKRLTAAQAGDPDYEHQVISLRTLGTVGPQLQAAGVRVDALGLRSPLGMPRILWRLIREIRRRRPDIVQCWMYHADLLGGLAARIAGVRHVIWGVRIADIGPEMGVSTSTSWVRRACAALSRTVPERIVYVAHSARTVHERLGYDPAKSLVIPNGYLIPPQVPPSGLRGELGIPADALLVGSAGRFNAQKDPETFVAAAGQVASRRPQAAFVMIGRGYSWDNEKLAGWIRAGGHAERFHLLGERMDLAACLPALDIFCLHSIGEGFPNVVAEAMSLAVPCVVTDVGDAALLVGETGVVVPPREPDRLARAIEALAEAGPEQRRRLGAQARERIGRDFSIDAISSRYAELYEALAGGEKQAAAPDGTAAGTSSTRRPDSTAKNAL